MTINPLASSPASGSTCTSRATSTSSTSAASTAAVSTEGAGRMRPPPPGDGGGLLGAIADALKSIGVDGGEERDGGAESAAATGTTSTEGDTGNAAQALGGFLEDLMDALHAQDSGAMPAAYGEGPRGGPGKLSSDLQSLIAALDDGDTGTAAAESTGSTASAASTAGTDSTDSTDSTASAGSVSALQGSFRSLLGALGSTDVDPDSKLSSFLQTLASKLPSAGGAGNLIDTTA